MAANEPISFRPTNDERAYVDKVKADLQAQTGLTYNDTDAMHWILAEQMRRQEAAKEGK